MEQLLFQFREVRCFLRAFWPPKASEVFGIGIRFKREAKQPNYCLLRKMS